MKPIVHLFTPIFFVTVGLSMNLRAIDWGSPFIWVFSGTLLLVAVAGKMAGTLLLRESWPSRVALGLIFAELGRSSGIFDATVYAGMVIVIALTTLAPPFVLKWFYGRYGSRVATS